MVYESNNKNKVTTNYKFSEFGPVYSDSDVRIISRSTQHGSGSRVTWAYVEFTWVRCITQVSAVVNMFLLIELCYVDIYFK